ncbi:trypsin epsilon-like [Anopheles bellator]|uniref:trypsin epsilon-like n=1 Tax=Anopheles bellator TaxID=139047 RepID=UPI002648A353|nr:trypsin epsilon-like [Anopheles bellator]
MWHTVILVLAIAICGPFDSSCASPSPVATLSVEEVIARVNRGPRWVATGNPKNFASDLQGYRIVGGTETSIEAVPYQVSLRYLNRHICGGSIISHSWILTAAHCLEWYPNNDQIRVHAGSSHVSSGGSLHEVFYYHLHPAYDVAGFQWDVATIRVRSVMAPGFGRATIALPPPVTGASEWTIGENVTVSGWGFEVANGRVADNLRSVQLVAVSRASCNESWSGSITEDMLCAGAPLADACDGDSGGPAVQDGVQYGIVSWGASKCGNLPGVYTNLAHPSIRTFIQLTTMV